MSDLIKTDAINEIEVIITKEAETIKNVALADAKEITIIDDEFTAEEAATSMLSLKSILSQIEASRKDAKSPALELGRRIDALAKNFIETVEKEHRRISRLVGAYQLAEREKERKAQQEARQKLREEEERLEAARVKALEESADMNEAADKIEALAGESVVKQQEIVAEASTKSSALKGVKVRKSVHFEVEDEALLLKSRPDLFSADDRKIRAALKLTQNISGLRIWEETKSY